MKTIKKVHEIHVISYIVLVSAFMAFRKMANEDSSRRSPRFFHSCQPALKLGVNFCKDHRDKIEVTDPLIVGDLISCKLNNKQKLARL